MRRREFIKELAGSAIAGPSFAFAQPAMRHVVVVMQEHTVPRTRLLHRDSSDLRRPQQHPGSPDQVA